MFSDQTLADLVSSLRPAFPQLATVEIFSSAYDVDVAASWLLLNDPVRPNKRTRPLSIRVPGDAMLEFDRMSSSDRSGAAARIVAFLRTAITEADLDHDAPYLQTRPTLIIVVPTHVVAFN